MSDDSGFLSRWARRKAEVKSGLGQPAPAPVVAPPAVAASEVAAPNLPPVEPIVEAPPAPTLEDVAALAPGDEVSRFVAQGVGESVKRAAVKKLFTDPHYNIMDGLDIYIGDYSQPDPIPVAMLRQMNQSKFLGLFAAEEAAEAQAAADAAALAQTPSAAQLPAAADAPADAPDSTAAAPPTDATQAPDEDPDLQLQPDDAAGRPGAATRAGSERR